MTETNSYDADDEQPGPDVEVWNHLEQCWQMAYDDIAFKLPPDMLDYYRGLSALIVGAKSTLRVDVTSPAFAAQVASAFPEVAAPNHAALLAGLMKWFASGKDRWLTHSVELELAGQGLRRTRRALDRFRLLAPQLGRQPIPERALQYVREAVSTFVFGFDASSIALCRSTTEQVAKEVLVRLGVYTWPQLQRAKPPISVDSLLEKLKQAGALDKAYVAAHRIKDAGNVVVHKHLYDEKIRTQLARDCIADLAEVLRELLP